MPAKDIYHRTVREVLLKDGWRILQEDYELEYGGDSLYPDFAAERSIVATRGTRQILVEVKSFIGRSFIADLQAAIGQYAMYQSVIDEQSLGFRLYLAITSTIYEERFQSPLAQLMVEREGVNLLVFDVKQEVVVQWIESTSIEP
ncbi:element excision factor XisH family protein [Alkalinema pantanalense CENA528]|uniref:element excision factor XisH family protein n=1 Tax=Alkalinema pantanalense TaxID=1620705 RepID=UPI003D6FA1EF